jgi:hypothetical protein
MVKLLFISAAFMAHFAIAAYGFRSQFAGDATS